MNTEQNRTNAISFYRTAFEGNPRKPVIRHISEEDQVTLHTHLTWPGNKEYLTIDFSGLTKTAGSWNIGMRNRRSPRPWPMIMGCIRAA